MVWHGADTALDIKCFHTQHSTDMIMARHGPCRKFFCSHTKTKFFVVIQKTGLYVLELVLISDFGCGLKNIYVE